MRVPLPDKSFAFLYYFSMVYVAAKSAETRSIKVANYVFCPHSIPTTSIAFRVWLSKLTVATDKSLAI